MKDNRVNRKVTVNRSSKYGNKLVVDRIVVYHSISSVLPKMMCINDLYKREEKIILQNGLGFTKNEIERLLVKISLL